MLRLFHTFGLLFFAQIIFAQQLDFAPKKKLFNHPIQGLFDFPFIPVDYKVDGTMDYIGRDYDQNLVVYSNTPSGYLPFQISSIEPFSRPFEVLDFNQDGYEDIVLAYYIYLYDPVTNDYNILQYSDEELESPTVIGAADFDDNGYMDLVTIKDSGSLQTDLSIHYWDGSAFEKYEIPFGIDPGPLRLGDLEGDGDIDIALIDGNEGSSPVILINSSEGGFLKRVVNDNAVVKGRTLDFADFDNDGDLDLLVNTTNNDLTIYFNSDNFLSSPLQLKVENNVNSLATRVGDLTGDGLNEIVTIEFHEGLFSVVAYLPGENMDYQFDKTMTLFSAAPSFITFNPNYVNNSLQIRDVDNDEDNDIILTFGIGSVPAVWLFENMEDNNFVSTTNEISTELSIFPNPAAAQITVVQPSGVQQLTDYEIYDRLGRSVAAGKINGPLDVAHLTNGTYVLKAGNGIEQRVAKFEVLQ